MLNFGAEGNLRDYLFPAFILQAQRVNWRPQEQIGQGSVWGLWVPVQWSPEALWDGHNGIASMPYLLGHEKAGITLISQ